MIRLVEYSTTRAALAPQDLGYLLDLVAASGQDEQARLLEAVTPTRDRGVYDLRSGPYVGRLGLPSGDWIDFVSRFAFDDVVELIRRSGRLPIRHDTLAVPAEPADALIDVIAAAFVREVARLVAAGLAKGYAKHHFEQPPYPGTIDAKQHLGRFAARPDRLVTLASRLTRDVPVSLAQVGVHAGAGRVAGMLGEVDLVADAQSQPPAVQLDGATALAWAEQLPLGSPQDLLVVARGDLAVPVEHQDRQRAVAAAGHARADEGDGVVVAAGLAERAQSRVGCGHGAPFGVGAQQGQVVAAQRQLGEHHHRGAPCRSGGDQLGRGGGVGGDVAGHGLGLGGGDPQRAWRSWCGWHTPASCPADRSRAPSRCTACQHDGCGSDQPARPVPTWSGG